MAEQVVGSELKMLLITAIRNGDRYLLEIGKTLISNGTEHDAAVAAPLTT